MMYFLFFMEMKEYGKTLQDIKSKLKMFLETYYKKQLEKLRDDYPIRKSIEISLMDIYRYDKDIFFELTLSNKAEDYLNIFKEILREDYKINGYIRFKLDDLLKKETNEEFNLKIKIKDLRYEHLGKLIIVEGIVRKVTDIKPKVIEAVYKCKQCGTVIITNVEDKIQQPKRCECGFTQFSLDIKATKLLDFQKALIQENLEELRGGEKPTQLILYLYDDIVGKINPGDKVAAIGILKGYVKKDGTIDIFLDTNNIETIETEYEEIEISEDDVIKIKNLAKRKDIFDIIVNSIAPHIYGYRTIKEAIALQLFSAPSIRLKGSKIRGNIHILLVGDPATGKSSILQYVKTLAPKCIYTTGRGSSAAGLTVALVRDEFSEGNSFSIEAGACVLADKGIVLIDEFEKMDRKDREALHEVMEQEQVSISKAGVIASFKARCSILAAANPKLGRFDRYKPIAEQIDLPPTIISRFDLIFFVMDKPEESEDVAKHILKTATNPEEIKPILEPEFLKKYVAYARRKIHPKLSDEAKEKIKDFYMKLRETASKNESYPIPITPRQLWSVIRLTLASARLRLSNVATEEDADRAINLMKSCLLEAGLDVESGVIDIDKIMVGIPKSQRDKISVILSIIKGLEETSGTAHIDEIIKEAQRYQIDEENVKKIINKLKMEGLIYEYGKDEYKVVR